MELAYSAPLQSFAFDRFQMRQVLDNLVSNVFRYAASFSLLKVSVTTMRRMRTLYALFRMMDRELPKRILGAYLSVFIGQKRDDPLRVGELDWV